MSSEFAPWLDLMTGAFRREHFEAEVAKAVQVARKNQRTLSLLWIDIDDLSEHNDLHGRDTLDGLIGWLASKLAVIVNGRGPIGRVEGGAFAVLLPSCTREEAVALSTDIRRVIPRTLHSSAFGDFRLTVSVGVATLKPTEPFGNFLEAAETACLRAKQGGRDTVVTR